MNRINSLVDFLAKLDKISYTSVDGTKTRIKGEVLGQSTEVIFDTKMSESIADIVPPLQAVIRVRMNGELVATWGASSLDDVAAMVSWFITKTSQVERAEWDAKRKAQEVGQAIFNSL